LFQPERIAVPNIPGLGTVTVRWIVKNRKDLKYTISVDSAKGGQVTHAN
jgi:hypothetical protein